MYCSNCGHKVNEGSNFCEKCGQKIDVKDDEGLSFQEEEPSYGLGPDIEEDYLLGPSPIQPSIPPRSERFKSKIGKLNKKWVIGGAIGLLILCAVILGVLLLPQESGQEIRLVDGDKQEYLLLDVDKNFEVEIKSEDGAKAAGFEIKDVTGKKVDIQTRAEGDKVIIAPAEGSYTQGETYTVSLKDGTSFANDNYKDARILDFKVERSQGVNASYSDNVKVLKKGEATIKNDSIETDADMKTGDIFIVEQGGDKPDVPCKIGGIAYFKDRVFAHFETPKIDEIYKTIDVNKTITSDGKYLSINEDAAVKALKESGALGVFVEDVDAITAGKLDTKVTQPEKNIIQVDIGVKDPQNPTRVLNLSFSVQYTVRIDIKDQERQFMDCKLKLADNVKVSVKGQENQVVQKEVEDVIAKFEKEKKSTLKDDETLGIQGFADIFTVQVPIEKTLYFNSRFGFVFQGQSCGKESAGVSTTTTMDQGILIEDGKVRKEYANVKSSVKGATTISGKDDRSASLMSTMEMELLPQSALIFKAVPKAHTEMEGFFITEDLREMDQAKGYYNLASGVKTKMAVNAVFDWMKKDFKYSKTLLNSNEEILEASNATEVKGVDLKKKYAMKDGKVNLKTINATYYDLLKESERKAAIKKYDLYIDDKKVKVKNGVIQDAIEEGSYSFKVVWQYDGSERGYTKTVEVVKSFDFIVETETSYQQQLGPFALPGKSRPSYYSNVNIVIPRVQDTTENSEACNKKIRQYCQLGIDMANALKNNTELPAGYGQISTFSVYHWSYEVHRYKDATALIISSSVRGNNWGGWDVHYGLYYDNSTGELMSPSDYAAATGRNADDILKFAKQKGKGHGDVYLPETINEFANKGTVFYVDSSGTLHVKYGFSK